MPPTLSTPWLVTFTSRISRAMPNRISSMPAVVHRQHLEGEEREQQAQPAGDAGQNRAGVPQLDRQAEHAEAEEEVGDVRVSERAQHALAPAHLDRHDARADAVWSTTALPSKRLTVRPSSFFSRSLNVARHDVDERRRRR